MKTYRLLVLLGVVLVVLSGFFSSGIAQVRASGESPNADECLHTIPTNGGVYDTLTQVEIVTPINTDAENVTYAYEVKWFMDEAAMGTGGLSLRAVESTPTNMTWQATLQNSPSPGNHSFTFRVIWSNNTEIEDPLEWIRGLWIEDFSGSFTITHAHIRYDFDELLNWTVVGGTWSVLNGLLGGFSSGEGLIYAGDMIWNDCVLTAKVKIAADSPRAEAAFCVCIVDSGNFYWAGLGCWGHRVSISRTVDSVPEELIFSGDSADIVKDVWYNLSIEVSGGEILLYVNDFLELVVNDSTISSGLIGVRTWDSHVLVDHVTVSGLPYMHYDFDELLDWTVVGGTWSVLNGLLGGFSSGEGLIYASDMVWNDFMLTAKVKIAADSPTAEAAFCVCTVDSENFYWAGLGCWGHRVSISRMTDHVPEELVFSGDSADIVKDVWYNLSIKVSGDVISLYVNDVLELVVNDSTISSGLIGVRTWDSHVLVDHVTVSGLPSKTTPTSVPSSSAEQFLSVFHTGTCLWDAFNPSNQPEYDTWTPAREAGVLKWGMAGQNIPSRGNKAWLAENGDISGAWTKTRVVGYLQKYFPMDIVPLMEMNFENFETASENAWRNFFTKLADWIDDEDPSKFIIWNCGAESNFADSDVKGWMGYKIDWRDYNRQMKVIRRVRDELGLQNKVLISSHVNLHKSNYVTATGKWVSQDWYTEFVGVEEYLPGFAQCDIMGFSHYMAYRNSAYNSGGLTWQEILQRSWKRTQIICEMVNERVGKTLPAFYFEFSLGNVWRKTKGTPIWKEGVTYVYEQMVKNNRWMKGLNWYTGWEFNADAMQELAEVAKKYDGY